MNHDSVVSLDERLDYLLGRYAFKNEEIANAIKINIEMCREVEKKLFSSLKFNPDELADLIKQQ